MPLVIGVTGSIASGKSLACRTLEQLGAVHCDADTFVHRLYDPGTPGFERVVAAFGEDIVGADGYIDRKILGARTFGNREAMTKLVQAIGETVPALRGQIQQWRETLPEEATAVMEAVLLIEADLPRLCDASWLVAVDDEKAVSRLIARNNLTEAEARQRLASQRPWQERAEAVDFVVHNDGTIEDLQEAVRVEHARLLQLKRDGALPETRYIAWRAAHPYPQRPQQKSQVSDSASGSDRTS